MIIFTRPEQVKEFIKGMGIQVPLFRIKQWIDNGIIPSSLIRGKRVMFQEEVKKWASKGHFRNGDIHYGWNIWAK